MLISTLTRNTLSEIRFLLRRSDSRPSVVHGRFTEQWPHPAPCFGRLCHPGALTWCLDLSQTFVFKFPQLLNFPGALNLKWSLPGTPWPRLLVLQALNVYCCMTWGNSFFPKCSPDKPQAWTLMAYTISSAVFCCSRWIDWIPCEREPYNNVILLSLGSLGAILELASIPCKECWTLFPSWVNPERVLSGQIILWL